MFYFRNRLGKQEREQMMAVLIALRNDVVSLKGAIDGLSERLQRNFEGLEKNDMAILERLDKCGMRLGELIENGAAVSEKKDGVTEAQVKREWFGEDELT